jgi:hypothetical protein
MTRERPHYHQAVPLLSVAEPTSYYMNALMLKSWTGTCLAPAASSAPRAGAVLSLRPCNQYAQEQQWTTYDGPRSQDMRLALESTFSSESTLCLTAQGAAAGNSVLLLPCNSTRGLHSTWLLDESSRLRPGHAPSLCLTVIASSSRAVLGLCSSSRTQVWKPTVPGE